MKVKSRSHVYAYLPDYKTVIDGSVVNNRQLPKDEQIVVHLDVISMEEDDAFQRESILVGRKFSPEKAQEHSEKRFKALVEKHFHGCEGLEIDGLNVDLSVWENFYKHAPREVVSDVIQALRSTEVLSTGEQKNFLPESGGRLSAPARKDLRTSAKAVKKTND